MIYSYINTNKKDKGFISPISDLCYNSLVNHLFFSHIVNLLFFSNKFFSVVVTEVHSEPQLFFSFVI